MQILVDSGEARKKLRQFENGTIITDSPFTVKKLLQKFQKESHSLMERLQKSQKELLEVAKAIPGGFLVLLDACHMEPLQDIKKKS